MNHIHTPNIHALAALAFLGAHERSIGNPLVPFQGFDLAPVQEEQPAAFLGNDYLGNDLLGAEQLMGYDPAMLGLDPLMGNDPLALLGAEGLQALLGQEGAAMLGRDPRRARMLAARAVAARARAAGAVAQGVPAVAREGYLPIPETAFAIGQTQVINIFPQAQGGIQLTRLMIPSNQGTRYMVNDVVVATRSQFFSPGAVSAVLCSEVQTMKLRGDVAYPGTIVSITVQNVSGATQTLQGAAFLAEAREARTV